ncbi:MAG: 5-deoxy-glucuronate isomerase [Veillonellales bacterium]
MSYLATAKQQKGYQKIFGIGEKTPLTGLGLLNLAAKEKYSGETQGEEVVVVILSGNCRITVGNEVYEDLGKRKDVFSGPAAAVYVPIHSRYTVTETQGQDLTAAVVAAVADKQFASFAVRPDEVVINHRGILNFKRDVHDIVVDNAEGKVDKIIVGETFAYPGQWSSYPSHKHDTQNPPFETKMDEIYHFRIKPGAGFGVQIMYTDDFSLREAYMIKDGDSVALPLGYHPVAAAPGYQLYYLWVMAGTDGRGLKPCDDPQHAWIQNIAPLLKD